MYDDERTAPATSSRRGILEALACGSLVIPGILFMAHGRADHDASQSGDPGVWARGVVAAVNAVVQSDIPIPAAAWASCSLSRLPTTLAEILPYVPAEHRALIQESARGRLRMRRNLESFVVGGLIHEESLDDSDPATLDGLFLGRRVDVATGAGLSDGPYPLRFDWAVVLAPESQVLFSFVLNCRD